MNRFDNIDCMQGMAEYEDNHFDLAIVDPPYGITATNGWDITKPSRPNHKAMVGLGYQKYDNTKEWDKLKPDREYFVELFRISKNQIVWGANYFVEHLPVSKGWIYWNKGLDYENSFNFSHGELAFTSFDTRLLSYKISPKAETRGGKDRVHPTQKPIALYKWLLTKYAKEGDLILDTHVGSASSLIACEDMGFNYVGFEIDKDYYEAARKRLKQFRKQLKLAL